MTGQNQFLYLKGQREVASKIKRKGNNIRSENFFAYKDVSHRKVERVQLTMFVINLPGRRLIPTVLEAVSHKNVHAIIKLIISQILENKRSTFSSRDVSENSKRLKIIPSQSIKAEITFFEPMGIIGSQKRFVIRRRSS